MAIDSRLTCYHFEGVRLVGDRGASSSGANILLNISGATVRVSMHYTNSVVGTATGLFIFVLGRKEGDSGISSCEGADVGNEEGDRGVGNIM